MIRITTGTAKNKRLKAPDVEGFRAVQEIAKSSLFSIIGEKIVGAVCLDLFAGSGNLGLEALSREASWCDFVDEHYNAIGTLRENIENCGFGENSENPKAEIIKASAVKFAANTDKKYDIIFLDPFYEDTSHIFLMKNLEEILNENGLIAFFHGDKLDIEKVKGDTGLKVETQRKFGKSFFTIFK